MISPDEIANLERERPNCIPKSILVPRTDDGEAMESIIGTDFGNTIRSGYFTSEYRIEGDVKDSDVIIYAHWKDSGERGVGLQARRHANDSAILERYGFY